MSSAFRPFFRKIITFLESSPVNQTPSYEMAQAMLQLLFQFIITNSDKDDYKNNFDYFIESITQLLGYLMHRRNTVELNEASRNVIVTCLQDLLETDTTRDDVVNTLMNAMRML